MVRLWRAGLLVAASAAGAVLGVGAALFGTRPGRELVIHTATEAANRHLRGTLTIGGVGGGFLRDLVVRDVALVGADGDSLFAAAEVAVGYNLRDLLGRRIVLGHLRLRGARVSLLQHPDGSFNVDEIFPGGDGGGRPPLIAFRNVRVDDASVAITTVERLTEGSARRARRISDLRARLPYARLASPDPKERGIVLQIASLSARLDDPALAVVDAEGRATVWGDSVRLELSRVRLPRTEARLQGTLRWPGDTLLMDLRANARDFATDDLLGLAPDLPPGLEGRGVLALRSEGGDALAVILEDADLEALPGGGRVRGRLGMVFGPGEDWRQVGTALQLENFDLERVRHLVDTLPVAGRLSGRVAADGPRRRFRLALDVGFRDSLVGGWPESRIRGDGEVSLGVPGDFVFHRYRVDAADLALGTVRRLIPAIELEGRLRGVGELSGPWLSVEYRGVLEHDDPPRPASRVAGTLRVDATGSTVGVWASLELDSLRFAGLERTFPFLRGAGSAAGHVALEGYLDALSLDAVLRNAGGEVRLRGVLGFTEQGREVRALAVEARDMNLATWHAGLPASRVSGRGEVRARQAIDRAVVWGASIALGPSVLRGTVIDSAVARVAVDGGRVVIDTASVVGRRVSVAAAGVLGLDDEGQGSLRFAFQTDSIGALDRWLHPLLGGGADSLASTGTVGLAGQVIGTLRAYALNARYEIDGVRRGALAVGRGTGTLTWVSASRALQLEGRWDSLEVAGLSLRGGEVRLQGFADSLMWQGRSGIERGGSWVGAGRWSAGPNGFDLAVDSLVLVLAGARWVFEPGLVGVSDSAIVTHGLIARQEGRPGAVELRGRFPFAGPANLTGRVVALPLADLWLLLGREYRDVSGELNGTLRIGGTAGAPIIEAAVAVEEAMIGGVLAAPRTTAVLRYSERQLLGEVDVRRGGVSVLEASVSLPVDLAFARVPRRLLPGALRVRAVADSVDFALLSAVTPYVRRAVGVLDADFGIGGTWEDPEFSGRLALRGAGADLPALGVRHEGIDGTFVLAGDELRVERLRLRSGRGAAEVTGVVRFEQLSRPLLDLRIRGNEFRVMDVRDFLTLTASGELELRGALFGATLSGRATANRGVLYFADLVTKDVVNLEDTLLLGLVDTVLLRQERLGAEFENRFLDALRIAGLEVQIGDDMWLRSAEANIQLRGAVQVEKEGNRYRLNGTLETPRGTYRLEVGPVTREFRVTRGLVRYAGTPDLNADLDIDAEHVVRSRRAEDVTVYVHIGGTLYAPRLRLTSSVNPPLSETEIISYLMFGADQVGTREAVLTSQWVSQQLLGVLSGELEATVISNVGVPLDYLQIRPATHGGGLGGTAIDIGKQFHVFGTTAFLTATPLLCPREGAGALDIGASLDFQLSRRWLLAASVHPYRRCETFASESTIRYQFGLDFFWETSY